MCNYVLCQDLSNMGGCKKQHLFTLYAKGTEKCMVNIFLLGVTCIGKGTAARIASGRVVVLQWVTYVCNSIWVCSCIWDLRVRLPRVYVKEVYGPACVDLCVSMCVCMCVCLSVCLWECIFLNYLQIVGLPEWTILASLPFSALPDHLVLCLCFLLLREIFSTMYPPFSVSWSLSSPLAPFLPGLLQSSKKVGWLHQWERRHSTIGKQSPSQWNVCLKIVLGSVGILWVTLGQINIIKKRNIDIQSLDFGELIKALFLVLFRRKIIYYL